MKHDHPDEDRLHFGCAGCVHRVQRDQFAAELAHLDLDDLLELCTAAYVPDWKWTMADAEIVRRGALNFGATA